MTTRSTHRPPVSSASLATLDQRRAALAHALSELASFCRGQLHEVYKRCGKPGCACATDPARRHGPYYAWQRCINGRIIQRTLQPAEAARVREGIACYEHFQALHDAYVAAMEAVHMTAAQPALPAAQKKKAPHPPTLRAAEGAYANHAREQARQEYETFLQEAARNEALKDCQCETCGGAMEVRGFLPFTLTTQLGPVTYTRRVYRCPHGHGGYAPFDRALGVYHHASPGMQQWMCFTAAKEAFHGAAETIHVLSGVAVSTAVVQEVAEWHGAQESARHEAATRRVFTPAQRPPEPAGPACLYIQVDGAHVPMRTKDTFHECSVAVLFEPPPDEHAHPVRAQYLAGMESWEAFGEKLFAAAWGRGVSTARNVVFMGDGAASNWSIAEMHFPHATQIVDFYHASEHIHAARLLGWGADDPGGQTWAAEQCHRLKHGAWDAFVAAFEQLPGASALQREKRDAALRYFVHNKQRMQYARYRARGLYIGSGMVESGCKLIVTQRMKITGAHWDEPGAQAMVHLRAAYLNGAFRSDWVLRLAA